VVSEVEYVVRVMVERVERRVQPGIRRGSVVDGVRDKSEVAAFTIRAASLPGLGQRVTGMLTAALPESTVKGEGELDRDYDEEDEDDR
jgi:hypothetical protein